MVPKLIGTKELENQQYIGQTPHKYVHIDMKMNFMHISSNLRLGGLYIGSKKESMTNKIHEVNMHAQNFQEPKPNDKEKPSEKDTKWRNHHLEDTIKDTSRNEISIDTLKKKDVKLPKERMVPNKPSPLQSFMMAQVPKGTACLPPKHT